MRQQRPDRRARLSLANLAQHPTHVVGADVALDLGLRLKLLQQLGGLGNALLVSFDVNPTVARGDPHTQGVANPPQVLITSAKGSQ